MSNSDKQNRTLAMQELATEILSQARGRFETVIEEMENTVLANLSGISPDYGRRKFAISAGTGIPDDILTVILKRLRAKGKVELMKIFSERTGRPDGSGYCLAKK